MKSTKQATWRQGSIMYSITPLNGGGSITRNMWQRCGSEGSCRGSSGSIIARSGMLPMRRGQDTTPEWYNGSFHAASMPQVVMLCRVEGLERGEVKILTGSRHTKQYLLPQARLQRRRAPCTPERSFETELRKSSETSFSPLSFTLSLWRIVL